MWDNAIKLEKRTVIAMPRSNLKYGFEAEIQNTASILRSDESSLNGIGTRGQGGF